MSTSTDTRRYTQSLTTWLQLREVDGERIGEIVAEVQVHVAESGEDAEAAFGPARRYAEQFGSAPRYWGLNRRTVLVGAVSGVGGALLADGFFASVLGGDAVLGLPGWVAVVVGLALLTAVFVRLPVNAVVDPRRPGRRGHPRVALLAVVTATFGGILGLAWLLIALAR